MIPVHIIGQPGAGKTTLIAELVHSLCDAGVTVGSIKHTAHRHELDKPGKDSFVHRSAGANPVSMITRELTAIYMPHKANMSPHDILERFYGHVDITLIEGWISGPYQKIEVWRQSTGRPPLSAEVKNTAVMVTDDQLPFETVQWVREQSILCIERSKVDRIVQWLLENRKSRI